MKSKSTQELRPIPPELLALNDLEMLNQSAKFEIGELDLYLDDPSVSPETKRRLWAFKRLKGI